MKKYTVNVSKTNYGRVTVETDDRREVERLAEEMVENGFIQWEDHNIDSGRVKEIDQEK